MADNLFSAVLTFSLLAAGTIAVGSEMVAPRQAAKTNAVALLPTVTVVGKRIATADAVTLPTVVVTGQRPVVTAAAIDDTGAAARVHGRPRAAVFFAVPADQAPLRCSLADIACSSVSALSAR
jgi:hypothetical protein